MSSEKYIEIRCNKDKKLLFRARLVPAGEIEIKCHRCGDKRLVIFPIADNVNLDRQQREPVIESSAI